MLLAARRPLTDEDIAARVGEEWPTWEVSPSGLRTRRSRMQVESKAAALSPAATLAQAAGAALSLIRVEPWRSEGIGNPDHRPDLAAAEAEAEAEAGAYLAGARAKLAEGLAVTAAVLRGRAAEAITGYAQYERVDLTVMTSHGRGGLRRAILGSIADRVIRSGIPTLLIRPAAEER